MAPQLTKAAALVFGAAALDVISSSAQLTAAVSGAAAASSTFPGLVSLAPGGVAFNICQCLSALEFPFTLATGTSWLALSHLGGGGDCKSAHGLCVQKKKMVV